MPPIHVQRRKLMTARVPDGKVCLNDSGELSVTKFAVEPVRVLSNKACSGRLIVVCRCGIFPGSQRDLASVRQSRSTFMPWDPMETN